MVTPSTGSDNSSASSDNSSAEGATYKVGICQLVQHAALDAATQGFEDALTASFGENVMTLLALCLSALTRDIMMSE